MSLKQENGEFREVDIYMKIVSFNYPEFLRDGFFIYVSIHLTNQFVYSDTLAELCRVFEYNVLFCNVIQASFLLMDFYPSL